MTGLATNLSESLDIIDLKVQTTIWSLILKVNDPREHYKYSAIAFESEQFK